jgi:hypothetical protein
MTIEDLVRAIKNRPNHVETWTPDTRPAAVAYILRGILDWLADKPTLAACIVEDIARAIEECGDDTEAIRHLSVVTRDLGMNFTPQPWKVALTEEEAELLHAIPNREMTEV